jgi:hypothetical protein
VNKRITAEQILFDPWCRQPGDKKPSGSMKKSTLQPMEESKFEEEKSQELKDFEETKVHVYECSGSDEIADEDANLNGDLEIDEGPGPGEYIPTQTIDLRNDGLEEDGEMEFKEEGQASPLLSMRER